ncbi:MAG: ABC transporter ATP-binding protein [Planctomycetota bacterium]
MTGAEAPAVSLRALAKHYGDRQALRSVDLEIPRGRCFGLLGSNGSGKTTLLKIVAGLTRATSGVVAVAGHEFPRAATAARRALGVLFDQPLLPGDFTLAEALRYTADLYQVSPTSERAKSLVERAGLEWRVRDPVRTFSRGLTQRVSLICALLHDPEVLLLDEPFVGLDPRGCRWVEEMIGEQIERGKTVVLVTHELARVERLCPELAVLQRGELVFRSASRGWAVADVQAVYG